jgi:hypothetical protein
MTFRRSSDRAERICIRRRFVQTRTCYVPPWLPGTLGFRSADLRWEGKVPFGLVIDLVPSHPCEGIPDFPLIPATAHKGTDPTRIELARHRDPGVMTGRPDVRDDECKTRKPIGP